MSEVKRYDPGCDYAGQDEMVESADGGYVKWEDYVTIKAERDALDALTVQPVKLAKDLELSDKAHQSHVDYAEGYNDRAEMDREAIRAAGYQVEGE